MIPVRRHHGFQAFASAMVIAFLASAASGSTVVDAVDEPASSRLEHASLEGDDRLSIWSPEALAARHERMRYAVDRPEPDRRSISFTHDRTRRRHLCHGGATERERRGERRSGK